MSSILLTKTLVADDQWHPYMLISLVGCVESSKTHHPAAGSKMVRLRGLDAPYFCSYSHSLIISGRMALVSISGCHWSYSTCAFPQSRTMQQRDVIFRVRS